MPLNSGFLTFSSVPKVAAVSLARPITERQSGLFEVISNSTVVSLYPIASCISLPTVLSQSSPRMKMPSSIAYGKS